MTYRKEKREMDRERKTEGGRKPAEQKVLDSGEDARDEFIRLADITQSAPPSHPPITHNPSNRPLDAVCWQTGRTPGWTRTMPHVMSNPSAIPNKPPRNSFESSAADVRGPHSQSVQEGRRRT